MHCLAKWHLAVTQSRPG